MGPHSLENARTLYECLQQAAECDLNDGFEFLIGRPVQMRAGAPQGSIRCHVEARLFEARNTHLLPARLPEPPPDWAEPYAALAREIGLPVPTLQEAYAWLDTQWCSWGLDNPGGQ